uniref:glycosyltransferase n=1 Tax=Pelomonas sp. KK5 TaxID=1855730 RepID=UPI003511C3AC
AGDRPLLCTWHELDHYGRAPEGSAWFGPSFLADTGTGAPPPPWPAGSGPRVFAYLKAGHADHAACLQALVQRGCRVICYLPEVAAGKPPPVRSPLLHYAAAPVSLGALLPDCELLVCHAGEATLAQGLLAGVPLLLMPMQAEQALLARTTCLRSGAAVNVLDLPPGTPISAAVERALGDAGLRERARAFAARYRDFTQAEQTEALVAQFEALLHR